MSVITLNIKKLNDNAVLPSYANENDAGLDLTATSCNLDIINGHNGAVVEYGTGLAVEIPPGFVGLLFPRSSVATKTSLTMANCVGVIDAGYRGEIKVKFRDFKHYAPRGTIYKEGDRVAQLVIMPAPRALVKEVDELSNSERGEGGFGSSGS